MFPVGTTGRFVGALTMIFGAGYLALLTSTITSLLNPTPFQQSVIEWRRNFSRYSAKYSLAAQIIQLCWRERKRLQSLLRAAEVRAQRGLVELEKNKTRPGRVLHWCFHISIAFFPMHSLTLACLFAHLID